jgi:hypothetical protein
MVKIGTDPSRSPRQAHRKDLLAVSVAGVLLLLLYVLATWRWFSADHSPLAVVTFCAIAAIILTASAMAAILWLDRRTRHDRP